MTDKLYYLQIGGVDGTTNYSMQSYNKAAILVFLQKYDHEGSAVNLIIDDWVIEDPHQVYTQLGFNYDN